MTRYALGTYHPDGDRDIDIFEATDDAAALAMMYARRADTVWRYPPDDDGPIADIALIGPRYAIRTRFPDGGAETEIVACLDDAHADAVMRERGAHEWWRILPGDEQAVSIDEVTDRSISRISVH